MPISVAVSIELSAATAATAATIASLPEYPRKAHQIALNELAELMSDGADRSAERLEQQLRDAHTQAVAALEQEGTTRDDLELAAAYLAQALSEAANEDRLWRRLDGDAALG